MPAAVSVPSLFITFIPGLDLDWVVFWIEGGGGVCVCESGVGK